MSCVDIIEHDKGKVVYYGHNFKNVAVENMKTSKWGVKMQKNELKSRCAVLF